MQGKVDYAVYVLTYIFAYPAAPPGERDSLFVRSIEPGTQKECIGLPVTGLHDHIISLSMHVAYGLTEVTVWLHDRPDTSGVVG